MARRRRVEEIIGYVLIAVLVLGLIYLTYWIVTEKPRPRYKGIEKFRGDLSPYRLDVTLTMAEHGGRPVGADLDYRGPLRDPFGPQEGA